MKVSLLLRDSVFMNRCLRAVHNGNSTLSDWCSGDFNRVHAGDIRFPDRSCQPSSLCLSAQHRKTEVHVNLIYCCVTKPIELPSLRGQRDSSVMKALGSQSQKPEFKFKPRLTTVVSVSSSHLP